jgi:hypothetical protein
MTIVSEVSLSVGAGEDREWTFSVVGRDMTNDTLKCALKNSAGLTDPTWLLSATVQSASVFLLAITAEQSRTFPPGDYVSDIRADDTVTGKRRFIVRRLLLTIEEQVTVT